MLGQDSYGVLASFPARVDHFYGPVRTPFDLVQLFRIRDFPKNILECLRNLGCIQDKLVR